MSYLKLFLCYIIVVLDNLFLLMNNKALVEMGVLFLSKNGNINIFEPQSVKTCLNDILNSLCKNHLKNTKN